MIHISLSTAVSYTHLDVYKRQLYKEERLIESAQQAAITVKGKEVLNFCANTVSYTHLAARSLPLAANVLQRTSL